MLEHQATTIDRLAVFTPTPIRVDLLIPLTASTLLSVEMIVLLIEVHGASAPITPNDGFVRPINFEIVHWDVRLVGHHNSPPLPDIRRACSRRCMAWRVYAVARAWRDRSRI